MCKSALSPYAETSQMLKSLNWQWKLAGCNASKSTCFLSALPGQCWGSILSMPQYNYISLSQQKQLE